jgi:hypothetical protein
MALHAAESTYNHVKANYKKLLEQIDPGELKQGYRVTT